MNETFDSVLNPENTVPSTPEETASAVTAEKIIATDTTGEPATTQTPAAQIDNISTGAPVLSEFTVRNGEVPKNFPWANCTELIEEDDDTTDSDIETSPADEAKLSPEYLANGFFVGEGDTRYPDPSLVSEMAEMLGIGLAICRLKPAAYNSLLKPLKKVNKRSVVFEAKRGALLALRPKIMLLEQKKRAPHILLEIIEANIAHLTDTADFDVCYQHLEAIGAFLRVYYVEMGAE